MGYDQQIPLKIAEDAALVAASELRSLIYFAGLQNVRIISAKNNPYENQALGYTPDTPVASSSQLGSGIPVYSDITLEGCSYTDMITGKVVNVGTSGQPYLNFQTCLITVTNSNKIIKTEIQGRNGTVKEYIGSNDASVVIKGVITSKPNVYPFDIVKQLSDWLNAPVSKGISCKWLNNLNIFNVVVEGFDLPQQEGQYSQQYFTINAISDIPVALKIFSPINLEVYGLHDVTTIYEYYYSAEN